MATTVNNAFNEFLKKKVNLDPDNTSKARKSRDNLISKIHKLGEDDEFFKFYTAKDISFGSFARRTKIRPLDDIDIMICISAEGSTYFEHSDRVEVTVEKDVKSQLSCCNTDSRKLNSTIVINKFLSKISEVYDYRDAEIHKRGEALTLQLKSYTWNFDIVPCFQTSEDSYGRSYYLIPDGKGNWKKTDPRKDRDRISEVNQKVGGKMLDTIRITKYWNKRPTMPTMPSYLLECIIVDYFDSMTKDADTWIDFRFRDLLNHLSSAIFSSVDDPKGIQGNLNTLSYEQQCKISERAKSDYEKACQAINFEVKDKDLETSIKKWKEIFGSEFPDYEKA